MYIHVHPVIYSLQNLFDPSIKLCAIHMCKCWGMPCFMLPVEFPVKALPLCLIFGFRSGCLLVFGTCIAEASAQQCLAFNTISLQDLLQLVLLVVFFLFLTKRGVFMPFSCLSPSAGWLGRCWCAWRHSNVPLCFQYRSSYLKLLRSSWDSRFIVVIPTSAMNTMN